MFPICQLTAEKRLENTLPGPPSLDFPRDLHAVGSDVGVNNIREWIHPTSTDGTTFKHYSRPCPTLYEQCSRPLMDTSGRIMHNVTKLISSQTGFWNVTGSSTGLHQPLQSPDLDRIACVCDVAEWEIHAGVML